MIIPQRTMHNWQNSFFFPKHPAHMQANPIYFTPFPLQRRSTTWRNIAPPRHSAFLSPSILRGSNAPPNEPEAIYDQEHEELIYEPDFPAISSFTERMMENMDSVIKIAPEENEKSPEEAEGLSHFKKWWYLRNVDISINGNLLTGFPIFIIDNTLRVINDKFSYFIPLRSVEYIRTSDGFNVIQEHFNGCLHD